MTPAKPRLSAEEVAKLASDFLADQVRPMLRPEDDDKFVALDVCTGDYEIDEDDYSAVMRLRARRPSAEIWLGRVGQPAAYVMRRRQ